MYISITRLPEFLVILVFFLPSFFRASLKSLNI